MDFSDDEEEYAGFTSSASADTTDLGPFREHRIKGIACILKRWDLPLQVSENYKGTEGYPYADIRFDTFQYYGEVVGGLNGTVAKNGLEQVYAPIPRSKINNNGRFDMQSQIQSLANGNWYNVSNDLVKEPHDGTFLAVDQSTDSFFNENAGRKGFDVMKGDSRLNTSSLDIKLVQHFPLRSEEPEPDPLSVLGTMKAKSNIILRLNSIYGPRPMQTMLVFAHVFDLCVVMKSPSQSWIKPEFLIVGKRLKRDRLVRVMKEVADRPKRWYSLFEVPREFLDDDKVAEFKNVVLGVSACLMKRLWTVTVKNVQRQDIDMMRRWRYELSLEEERV